MNFQSIVLVLLLLSTRSVNALKENNETADLVIAIETVYRYSHNSSISGNVNGVINLIHRIVAILPLGLDKMRFGIALVDSSSVSILLRLNEEASGDEIRFRLDNAALLKEGRSMNSDEVMSKVRSVTVDEELGNRPDVPNIFIFVTPNDPTVSRRCEKECDTFCGDGWLKEIDLVIGVTYDDRDAYAVVCPSFKDGRPLKYTGGPDTNLTESVRSFVEETLTSCPFEVKQLTPCYYNHDQRCVGKSERKPSPGPVKFARSYCFNNVDAPTACVNGKEQCERRCNEIDNATIDWGPCDATCGPGKRKITLRTNESSMYYENCPTLVKPCSMEPCPGAVLQASPSQPDANLPTWSIAVIAVVGAAIVVSVILIVVIVVVSRRRSRPSRGQQRKSKPHAELVNQNAGLKSKSETAGRNTAQNRGGKPTQTDASSTKAEDNDYMNTSALYQTYEYVKTDAASQGTYQTNRPKPNQTVRQKNLRPSRGSRQWPNRSIPTPNRNRRPNRRRKARQRIVRSTSMFYLLERRVKRRVKRKHRNRTMTTSRCPVPDTCLCCPVARTCMENVDESIKWVISD